MDRSLVSRATDGSDAPTPGYLYNDIAKNASSSPIAASEIATYLTRRLASKNNPNIKYKCLKVIAKVAVSPVTRGQLKRAIAQDASAVGAIKDAILFRGPPDPARGDEYNERVRVAAKEALDAIYSDTPAVEQQGANVGVSSGSMASASYGPSPHMSGGGGGMGGSSRTMQGIGNPMYADPRLEAQKGIAGMTVGEVVGVAGETIAAMVKDPLARKVEVPPPRGGGMPGYGGGGVSLLLCNECCGVSSFQCSVIHLTPILLTIHLITNAFIHICKVFGSSSWTPPIGKRNRWRVDHGFQSRAGSHFGTTKL